MTDAEADAQQQWAGMDGAIAFHLIDRHADSWDDCARLMYAWLRANGGSVPHLKPTPVGISENDAEQTGRKPA